MSSRLLFLIITVIIAWVLAFNSGRTLAFNLAYLMTAVLGLSYYWAWGSLRNVNLRRFTRTRRGQVGQFAEETFEVTNRSRTPKLWLEIEDHSRLPGHQASRVVSSLRGHTSERWQIRTLCTQRGRFSLGPMSLRSGDPLGIFESQQLLTATSHIVIYPYVAELTSFEPSVSDLSGGEARRQRTAQITTNVSSVRDYAPGDSLNRIHWPTTARTRRLMTKEFELDPTADVWVYLDLNQGAQASLPWNPHPPEQGLFALRTRSSRRNGYTELPPITTEYAVSTAASLARYFLMRNRSVGLSSYASTREFIQTDRGERQINKIMEALAVVEANGNIPFSEVIATDAMRLNRNDTILAVSSDPDPAWVMALHETQRRGVKSIAIVIDASTFGDDVDYDSLLSKLEASRIPYYRIRRGDDLADSLGQPAVSIDKLIIS